MQSFQETFCEGFLQGPTTLLWLFNKLRSKEEKVLLLKFKGFEKLLNNNEDGEVAQ